MKRKKCGICKGALPGDFAEGVRVCSLKCGMEFFSSKRHAELAISVKNAKPLSYFASIAQKRFNAYILNRDKGLPCVSCGTTSKKVSRHASHYLSTIAVPQLRFNIFNCHQACQQCNRHLSGNLIRYRQELVLRVGVGRVEWMEALKPEKLSSCFDKKYLSRLGDIFARRNKCLNSR